MDLHEPGPEVGRAFRDLGAVQEFRVDALLGEVLTFRRQRDALPIGLSESEGMASTIEALPL